jgi:hypothetical protein
MIAEVLRGQASVRLVYVIQCGPRFRVGCLWLRVPGFFLREFCPEE